MHFGAIDDHQCVMVSDELEDIWSCQTEGHAMHHIGVYIILIYEW